MNLADIRHKLRKIEENTTISSKNMMVSVTLKDGSKSVSNFTDQKKFENFIEEIKNDASISSYYISYSERLEKKDD
jgi:hypothetical protein